MSVGTDKHIYHATVVPNFPNEVRMLTEMAGPRAKGRSIIIQNNSDVDVDIAIHIITAEPMADDAPFLTLFLRKGNQTPQTVIINAAGIYPAEGTQLTGDLENYRTGFLSGSLPGLSIAVDSEERATVGAVHCEISCYFDS